MYDSWCLQWMSLDFVCCFSSLAHWHLQSFTWTLQILHFYPLWATICDFDGQLRISGLSKAVMPRTWSLWWTLISQRLSGHILLRGEHGCSRDRALEWTQKTHDHWCVAEIPILESMESWHNITPSAIQSENDVSCAWLLNGMKLILAAFTWISHDTTCYHIFIWIQMFFACIAQPVV